jgi:hypothetical protein
MEVGSSQFAQVPKCHVQMDLDVRIGHQVAHLIQDTEVSLL